MADWITPGLAMLARTGTHLSLLSINRVNLFLGGQVLSFHHAPLFPLDLPPLNFQNRLQTIRFILPLHRVGEL